VVVGVQEGTKHRLWEKFCFYSDRK